MNHMMGRMAVSLVAVLVASGCGGPAETPTASEAAATAEAVIPDPDSASAAGAVDWSKYDSDLQTGIDEIAVAGDCDGLQAEFEAALELDVETRESSGTGAEDLLAYIDERLRESDCA